MFEHQYAKPPRRVARLPRPVDALGRVRLTKKGARLLAAHEARRWRRAA